MPEPVTVGLVAPIFNNMPVWAASHLGYFGDVDLVVTDSVLYGVQNVTNAVRDRTVDIGIGTPESVLANTDESNATVIIAGNARKLANSLIARLGITTIDGLRGGTIGVSHLTEGTALLVKQMLAAHGLTAGDDYTLEAIGVASQRWDAIQQGTLDAGLQTPPHKYLAEDAGYSNLGDIFDYVPEYQFTTVNVRADWAAVHRGTVVRFLSATRRATQWLYDEPAAATALAAEALSTTAEYARRDYEHFRRTQSLTPDLTLSDAGMTTVVDLMRAAGTLPPGADAGIARSVDLSFLQEAATVPSAEESTL